LSIPEITRIEAVDLYRGKNVPAGKYSLMMRVTIQNTEATLGAAELKTISDRIVANIVRQLDAKHRAS
jgi:phenylalanyl-tRNA synthetase beta subunit